ncbi:LysR family transcriptional regulator [Ruminococcus sp. OA3]|uniref:LysR family transcriptional regulator n=1 Tax=Ruminococcus sp. OA3 TaxID=2914164 RepID=UPI001F051CAE|nr:LysR family transcriptional regulator [Ruminococcus sp. OA3]MCH1983230.1 LysR family transcriptional regulator [Ruminococcus sp. OA3]
MDQNLSLYRIFYTVANTQNISKAASELFISQPAISKSLRKLEENLNLSLFLRNSRGVTLTAEGKTLYTYVSQAFDALQAGEEKLRQIQELGIGHIRIGVSSTLCKFTLLPYLEDFIKTHPHIRITIECQSTSHTLSLLRENKIDLGLIGRPETLPHLQFDSLGEIEDIFVATGTYLTNLTLRSADGNADIFKNATLMLLDKGNITRQYIDDYLALNHIETSNVLEISTMDLLIEFAKISLGVACVIKQFVQNELTSGELLEIPLEYPIRKREIGFAYPRQASQPGAVRKFIDFCLKKRA